MHVNEIKVTRRKNLGNYEHFEVALGASIDEGENFEEAYAKVLENLRHAMSPNGGKIVAETQKPTAQTEPVKAEPAKKAPKKAPAKKKAAAKKEPLEQVSKEEIMQLCRDTANRLGSADKIKELIKQACKVDNLKDATPDTFGVLKKLLADA